MRTALSVAVGLVVLSAVAGPAAAGATAPTSDESPYSSPAAGTDPAANGPVATDGNAADASDGDACEAVANGTVREDPDSDRLGWENGCWYDESIDVTRSDGLNETELDAVVARAMARVETVRDLEFDRSVPVDVVSRERLGEILGNQSNGTTTAQSLHQNVKWEAMLMVGEDTDAIGTQEQTQGATVGGFYSPAEERIVIVSENTTSPKMNEITLSQELFHALQDQQFNVSSFDQRTRELHNARDGIIEGDGNLVDRLYERRCDAEWDCLRPRQTGNAGGGDVGSIHYGMYFVTYQPYSDGPKFVEQIYDERGWDGVDAVYENPPASTEQTIHPERYLEDPPTNVSVTDRSSDEWRVPDLNGSVDYASFGEAGMASMLFYPSYASGGSRQPVVPVSQFINYTVTGQLSRFDPFNYSNEYTTGWDGDKLYPYVTDDSAETDETGYVWKSVWDSERDAEEFVDGYRQLLDYHGAESVDGREGTYRVPDGQPFSDAFSVSQEGDTVVLVNAPSAGELGEVREGAAPETDADGGTDTPDDATSTDTPGDANTTDVTPTDATPTTESPSAGTTVAPANESPDSTDQTDPGATADPETSSATPDDDVTPEAPASTTAGDGPGFGVLAAVAAVALAALAAHRGPRA